MKRTKLIKTLKKIIVSKPFIILICVLIVYLLLKLGIGVSEQDSILDLIEFNVVISVGITTVVAVFVNWISNYLNKYLEEGLKLTESYEALIKRYKKEKFMPGKIITKQKGLYVVKDVDCPIVELADKPSSLDIIVNKENFKLDPIIVTNANKLISAHENSKINNKDILRLDHFDKDVNGKITLEISMTNFYNTLLTNRAMDYELTKKMSVREMFEYGPHLNTFKLSKMANGVGVSSIVLTKDGYYVMLYRGMKNPTGKHQISICNSTLNFYLSNKNTLIKNADSSQKLSKELTDDLIYESILNGLIVKLHYPTKGEYALSKKDYQLIGMVRNIKEGGKPELFYVVKTKYTKQGLLDRMKHWYEEDYNSENKDEVRPKKKENEDTYKAVFINKESIESCSLYCLKTGGKRYNMHFNALYFVQKIMTDSI
ncbi:MAG: hypothetical protein CVV56_07405 [Tenericutes bacterium HGW-Tenericutes-1]|jgi:hypothetical protein|nr:MAG: hypothetical protein CVV56_07405 [Tenericutes bacterium HGW-Tenericutes-1]